LVWPGTAVPPGGCFRPGDIITTNHSFGRSGVVGPFRPTPEYEAGYTAFPQTQAHPDPPSIPSRNSDGGSHLKLQTEGGPPPEKPIQLSPFVPRLPSSLQLQINMDFGFGQAAHKDQIKYEYDSTGIFHWVPHRHIEDVLVTRQEISRMVLNSHVVVCLFADADSPSLGLRNLIMPLRASNIRYHELKHVVIVGNADYVEREWETLATLPKISILHGTPMSRADLRAVNVNLSDMCVIISAKISNAEDPSMADKEAVLASLNINAMTFNKHDSVPVDFGASGSSLRAGEVYGARVRMVLTEVVNDSNIQYLNPDDDDEPGVQLYVTQAFATGTALAVSVLDSIMSTAYYNHQALTLIKSLISGGMTPELEIILAEGAGMEPGYSSDKVKEKCNRCRLGQVSLLGSPLERLCDGIYEDLFVAALRDHGMLSIGLYRYLDLTNEVEATIARYVITNPPSDFKLHPTDKVFVFIPYSA